MKVSLFPIQLKAGMRVSLGAGTVEIAEAPYESLQGTVVTFKDLMTGEVDYDVLNPAMTIEWSN